MTSKKVTRRQELVPGTSRVYVVQKHHQRTGQETLGTVATILTNSANHHQGIKVRLESGVVGRVTRFAHDDGDDYDYDQHIASKDQQPSISDYLRQEQWPSLSKKDEAPWACKMCTYLNANPYHLQCAICGSERSND